MEHCLDRTTSNENVHRSNSERQEDSRGRNILDGEGPSKKQKVSKDDATTSRNQSTLSSSLSLDQTRDLKSVEEREKGKKHGALRICLCYPSNVFPPVSNNLTPQAECNSLKSPAAASTNREVTDTHRVRFRSGDLVYYRPRSDKEEGYHGIYQHALPHAMSSVAPAKVPSGPPPSATSPVEGSYQSVETRRLVPVFIGEKGTDRIQQPTLLIVTPTTERYRQMALSQPLQNDDILEVGCSTGQTSQILVNRGVQSWVGLDTSTEMIDSVQRMIPNMKLDEKLRSLQQSTQPLHSTNRCQQTFSVRVDALLDPLTARKVALTFSPSGPSTVFVDIGGNRPMAAVLNMLDFLWKHFGHMRQVIVKSETLFQSLVEQTETNNPNRTSCDHMNDNGWTVQSALEWIRTQQQVTESAGVTAEHVAGDPKDHTSSERSCTPYTFPKHALKAPLRLSPVDQTTPICRYHNYHRKGCRRWLQQQGKVRSDSTTAFGVDSKMKVNEEKCPFDHEHCHWCLNKGHVALDCPLRPRRTT